MDKRFVYTVAAVLAVTVGAAALANRPDTADAAPLHENVSGIDLEPEDTEGAPGEQSTPGYQYILREYEGRVAVFSADNDTEPVTILDTLVKYLPDYDRSQMQAGIPVRNFEELVSLIEDYVS